MLYQNSPPVIRVTRVTRGSYVKDAQPQVLSHTLEWHVQCTSVRQRDVTKYITLPDAIAEESIASSGLRPCV